MSEHGCPGCDEKAALIRQYKAAVKEFCVYCQFSAMMDECETCPHELATRPGNHEHIKKVLDGTMPEVPAETQAKILGELNV